MKKIKRQFRIHEQWVEKNALDIEGRELAAIHRFLAEKSVAGLMKVSDSLGFLADVHASRGFLKLNVGDDAVADIARSIEYRGWSVFLRARLFSPIPFNRIPLTNDISRAACLVCCGGRWADYGESLLRAMESTPGLVNESYWKKRKFEPFVLSCCDLANGDDYSHRATKEPYSAVLEAWNDQELLGIALRDVCQYHVNNMDDHGGSWDPEFKHTPFDLLPCEVLLVRRCRRLLSLPMPDVDHELVHLYDKSIRGLPFYEGDDLFNQVAEEVHDSLGHVGFPLPDRK